jgi:hypothetical protein
MSIIAALLTAKPTKRLGVSKQGALSIKTHAWFVDAKFDWLGLYNRKVKAPFVPKIKNKFDLSNFERYPEGNSGWQPYKSTDDQSWFKGFATNTPSKSKRKSSN